MPPGAIPAAWNPLLQRTEGIGLVDAQSFYNGSPQPCNSSIRAELIGNDVCWALGILARSSGPADGPQANRSRL